MLNLNIRSVQPDDPTFFNHRVAVFFAGCSCKVLRYEPDEETLEQWNASECHYHRNVMHAWRISEGG